VGRFSETLSSISLKPQSPADDPEALARLSALIRGVASVLPDLSKFNVTPNVVYGHALQADVVLWATLEGGTYALLLLVLASWLLSRRDFI
jgi:hypothetical protein